jgi:ATP-dependent DNA helicase RecG
MTQGELATLLKDLMALPAETEWVEFKEAKSSYDLDKMGKYFSALSNETNLKKKKHGWLVFGVSNKPRRIVGTRYRQDRPSLDSLKNEVANGTGQRITFEEIHEIVTSDGRVLLFQIPPVFPRHGKAISTAATGNLWWR